MLSLIHNETVVKNHWLTNAEFTDIVAKHDERGADAVGFLDRFAFYDAAKDAYAVVSTSETAFYACIMIQKGCL